MRIFGKTQSHKESAQRPAYKFCRLSPLGAEDCDPLRSLAHVCKGS